MLPCFYKNVLVFARMGFIDDRKVSQKRYFETEKTMYDFAQLPSPARQYFVICFLDIKDATYIKKSPNNFTLKTGIE